MALHRLWHLPPSRVIWIPRRQKPTNREVGVAGRTEKVVRPETDGEDRQVGSERGRLQDPNRAKKIKWSEASEEGRKTRIERRRSVDWKRARKVARPESSEEDQVIWSERRRSQDRKRAKTIIRLETNGENRKVDDHQNADELEGWPAWKWIELMKTVSVQVVQDASPGPGSAKRSGRTIRVTR